MPDLRAEVPGIAEYIALRAVCGLGTRTEDAARIGLSGGLHSITARESDILIGMGRIIGDGGLFAQVTDIAVHPDHQGSGIGHEIVARLTTWCETELPATCYLSLIADPPADRIYAKFGFEHRIGMGRYVE